MRATYVLSWMIVLLAESLSGSSLADWTGPELRLFSLKIWTVIVAGGTFFSEHVDRDWMQEALLAAADQVDGEGALSAPLALPPAVP